VLTPALWSVLAPPLKPVAGTDSRVHLSYELLFTNVTKAAVRVQAVEVIDPAHPNQTLGQNLVMTDEGDDVTNRLRPLAISPITLGKADYSDQLEPGQSALMYFDVTLQPGEAIPHEVAHRVTLSQAELQNAASDNMPLELEPALDETATAAFTTAIGGHAQVDGTGAVVLSPPLQGDSWVDSDGAGAIIGAHRYASFSVNGTLFVPQTFAIDFVQVDATGHAFTGDQRVLANWVCFGKPVLSVAPGRVIEAVDAYPDNVPPSKPPFTLQGAGGNHVLVDLGDGRYAFYGHLERGSVAVYEGEFVFRGQQLGLLGNSGNSEGPHLHFQVSDRASATPLAAIGLPFVFERQVFEGRVVGIGADGSAIIDRTSAGVRLQQMPLTNDVLGFR
jgi:murein DD-endopeptidase MepM/ murein hydrolase activator NlpD